MNEKLIYILIIISLLLSACASTKSTESTQVQTAATVGPDSSEAQQSSGSMLVHESDLKPFADRIQWPEKPALDDANAQPSYVIESGVDEGVWLEGKGYFRGTVEDIFKTFINYEIMGPTYMTKDVVVDEYKESEVLTTYVMHVKLRYIMTVEFDVGVSIDAIYDSEDNIIGYRYSSSKKSGTRFITRIEETIVAKKLDDNWFSVEAKSLNVATMNKEEETRKHLETLFGYWSGK